MHAAAFGARGHGLFDQQVDAAFGAGGRGGGTLGVRQEDGGEVELFFGDHLAPVGVGAKVEVLAEGREQVGVGIGDGYEVEVFDGLNDGHVAARVQMAQADDCDGERFAHDYG